VKRDGVVGRGTLENGCDCGRRDLHNTRGRVWSCLDAIYVLCVL
jgi:hypothetical protein